MWASAPARDGMKSSSITSVDVKNLVVIFVLLSQLFGQTSGSNKEIPVTAVKGESWISHLHKKFSDTSMGKTYHSGPVAPMPGEKSAGGQEKLSLDFAARTMAYHGSDVYRLNCRGCHEASGHGMPPEINSVIDPVRATSVKVIMERMKKAGMNMSRANAALLAKQSNTALLDRFTKAVRTCHPFLN